MGDAHDNLAQLPATYSVRSTFHSPPAEFDGCFTTFYHVKLEIDAGDTGATTLHDYLQPEWANIRFFAGATTPTARIGSSQVSGARFTATGPSSLPCKFELGPSRMWGIGFLPLGWARFFDTPACDLTNIICDGESHPAFAKFEALAPALCDPELSVDQQFDAIVEVLRAMTRPHRDESKIVRIHEALVEGSFTAVCDLADACNMSIRTLERVCARHFGFSPKLLMRRQRFMRSLSSFMLHKGARWTESMDRDYHDQAQFTREFHEFMTMNPSEYASLDHPILSSFMEARARIWGSAAQTLDRPSH